LHQYVIINPAKDQYFTGIGSSRRLAGMLVFYQSPHAAALLRPNTLSDSDLALRPGAV